MTLDTVLIAPRRIDLRLALPAIAAWTTTAVLVGVPAAAVGTSIGAFAACFVLLAAATLARGERSRARIAAILPGIPVLSVFPMVTIIAAAVALAAVSVAAHDGVRNPEAFAAAKDRGVHVDAVVSAGVARASGVWPVTVVGVGRPEQPSDTARNDEGPSRMSVPALIFDGLPNRRIELGAEYAVSGTLRAAAPGETAAYLLFADDPAEKRADPPAILAWANVLRAGLSDASGRMNGSGAALLPGLAIGDTGAVSAALDAAMKASALSHLTAVSGANCAVVVALVMLVGARLGTPRSVRVAVALAVLAAFVVLVTPEPSVVRAAVMATFVLIGLASGRPIAGIPVLSLAVLVILVGDPQLSRNYGFALSVLATAGILVLTRPISAAAGRIMPRPLAIALAVPLAAQLACQPVLILLNPSIPVFGLIANVVTAPAAPIATVLGLAACVLLPVVPVAGQVGVALAWIPATWIAAVAEFVASVPVSAIPWPSGAVGLVSLAIATVGALIGALGTTMRMRVVGAAVALLAVAMVAAGGVAVRWAETRGRPPNWQIAVCDVGQGDAIVVRSADRIALIDTGPRAAPLASCLDDLAVTRIDLLVLTHFDLDHVGGIAAIEGRVETVLVGPSGGSDDELLASDLAGHGARVERVGAGASGVLGELRWRVLWPSGSNGFPAGNPSSVVTQFEPIGECRASCLSAIFLGDLGEDSQRAMLRASNPGEVDVVGVAHHGSADQYAPLYARLNASLGIIGVGADNRYGHPTASLLGILTDVGTTSLRTDRDGLVLVAPNPSTGVGAGTLRVWTERARPAEASDDGADG